MRILLVKPYPEILVARRLQEGFLHLEPLELEIVAGGVPEDDEVEIIDLSTIKNPMKNFHGTLNRFSPDIVGFTGYSTNVGIVKKLSLIVKEFNPAIITIVGGVHATLLPGDYITEYIDIIVRGEGGTVLREIIKRFNQGEKLYYDNYALSPEDKDFDQKAAEPPPAYPPINEIPLPRRDLVKRSNYFCAWSSSPTGKLATMFPQVATFRTSIGCPFSCSFCVVPHLMKGKYLQRSPEDVVDEIETLNEDYIYFVDDEMFINTARVTRIAQLLLQRKIKKKYISWARSDTIVKNPKLFELWKQVGLSTLYVGLESMDATRLDEYKKRTDVETNRQAVAVLKKTGIILHAAFIVHPDFTVEDFKRLEIEVLNICPAEVTFTVLSPSPGTKFWDQHKDEFICDPYKFYDCMHSILPTRIPLKRFYQHFGRLTSLALRSNPLRMNKTKIPLRDLIRAIINGTKYIFSLYGIYKDYPPQKINR